MTYLSKILEEKQHEVDELKSLDIERRFEAERAYLLPARDFTSALRRSESEQTLRLIAELKKASPSRGVLVEAFKPVERAKDYAELGAAALSVLTDEKFFQGKIAYLEDVRAQLNLPALRKDFIIDEVQIYQTRIIGADAMLLIVAALEAEQYGAFLQLGGELGLHILTEVHNEWELERAMKYEPKIIGVNNRNLNDFSVSLQTSLRVRKEIPNHVVSVSESGVKSEADLLDIERAKFDAVLIGEGLTLESDLATYWKKENKSAQ